MKLTGMAATLCSVLTFFAACKKSDNNNDTNNNNNSANTLTKRQMLIAGKWQLSASIATINYMGKDTTLDIYSQTDDCEKDNFILFADNGNATLDEGANKCSYNAQLKSAYWALLSDDTKLALIDNNPDTLNVEITSAEMKMKRTAPNSNGDPINYTETYKNIK